MKQKQLPAWKEAMISEIRRMNAFIRFLQTVGAERSAVKRLKIRHARSTAFRVAVKA